MEEIKLIPRILSCDANESHERGEEVLGFKTKRPSFQGSVFSKRGGNGAHASTRGDAEGENRASGQTRDRLPQGSSEGGAGREILRIN